MWTDINPSAQQKLGWTHLVEENEGADHLPLGRRQSPAHFEAAEIAGAGDDHHLDLIGGTSIARRGIRARLPAHRSPPLLALGISKLLARLPSAYLPSARGAVRSVCH